MYKSKNALRHFAFPTLIAAVFIMTGLAHAAPVLSSVSHIGTASASTDASTFGYRYVGGGPKSGPGHLAYVVINSVYQPAGGTAALNASTGLVSSIGTTFAPTYAAYASDTNILTDDGVTAFYRAYLKASTTFTSQLAANQGVSLSAGVSDVLYFTTTGNSQITATLGGTPGATILLTDVSVDTDTSGSAWSLTSGGKLNTTIPPSVYKMYISYANTGTPGHQSFCADLAMTFTAIAPVND